MRSIEDQEFSEVADPKPRTRPLREVLEEGTVPHGFYWNSSLLGLHRMGNSRVCVLLNGYELYRIFAVSVGGEIIKCLDIQVEV